MTCFQDTAEFILGQNAAFLGELKEKVSQLAYCISTFVLKLNYVSHLLCWAALKFLGVFFDPSGKEIFL